jgi:hypothetical protein
VSNGAFGRGAGVRYSSSSGNISCQFRDATINVGLSFVKQSPVDKTAFNFSLTEQSMSANGQAVQATSSSLSYSPSLDRLLIGTQDIVGSNRTLNGHIRRLAFFPRRLADVELTSITS